MADLIVTRPELARVLGTSVRSVERMEAHGVITPVEPPRRGQTSRYDLATVVPAVLAHRARPAAPVAETPRDRRDRAVAELTEIRIARERRALLPRQEVVDDGQAAVRAIVTQLRALAPRLLQAGAIEAAAVPAVEGVMHEALAEMAAWRTRLELLALAGDEGDA